MAGQPGNLEIDSRTKYDKEMKQYVIKAYDGEGKLDKRMEVRRV